MARLDVRRVRLLPLADARTCARARASPATTSTAASPSTPSPTRATASRCRSGYDDADAAPLLCAGLIGYRALRMAGDARSGRPVRLRRGGAHRRPGGALRRDARSTRSRAPGDAAAQAFARELGAAWAGGSDERAAGGARRRHHLRAGGRAGARRAARRCAGRHGRAARGIHMSDIPSFPYELLWGERALRSVANLTRARRRGVPGVAPRAGVHDARHDLSARARRRRAGRPARRPVHRGGRCWSPRRRSRPSMSSPRPNSKSSSAPGDASSSWRSRPASSG